jgi:hypothetical protein
MRHTNMSDPPGTIIVYLDPELEDIVPGFLDNRRKDLQILTACTENGQLDMIRLLGHRMKGDGGGYGFKAISDSALPLCSASAAHRQDHLAEGSA